MCRLLKLTLLVCFSMVFCTLFAQTSVWRDIYKVKKKDTIYGISQNYGLTTEELMNANPEMRDPNYVLKKGAMIFIPYPHDKIEMEKSIGKTLPHQELSVGVMLPLHDIDSDGRRMVEYYRGLLMACDTLKSLGISTNIYAWNVNIDADIRLTLQDKNAKDLDIIFGPLYTNQVKPLADFCRTNDIKLVIPFSTTATDVRTNDHVYQVYQTPEMLNIRAINAFFTRFKDYSPIFVDCNDSTSQKGAFITTLRKEMNERSIPYKTINLAMQDEDFQMFFTTNKQYVIVLDTARSPELNLVFRRLNELKEVLPDVNISMFGYTEWLMYESTYRELYHTYDVYIPSTFYYYKGLSRVAIFEQDYRRWFDEGMQERFIPRMALTGYDQAQFFLRGLYYKGSEFQGTTQDSSYKPLQTPLRFEHFDNDQGMQNTAFELVHYKKIGVIETIAY